MAKKPNAANITHGLAQLGGGAKKDGGGGMMKGVESIFNAGVNYGFQQTLGNNQTPEKIGNPAVPLLSDGEDEK